MQKSITGFNCTGIFPFDPDVFSAEDFAPSEVVSKHLYIPDTRANEIDTTTNCESFTTSNNIEHVIIDITPPHFIDPRTPGTSAKLLTFVTFTDPPTSDTSINPPISGTSSIDLPTSIISTDPSTIVASFTDSEIHTFRTALNVLSPVP